MALSSVPGEVVGPSVVSREPSETGSESWSPFARPKGAMKALTRLLRLRPEYQVLSGGEAKWLKHPLAAREWLRGKGLCRRYCLSLAPRIGDGHRIGIVVDDHSVMDIAIDYVRRRL